MQRICVYPGSFDPVTAGHMDIIGRIVDMFDQVVVGVLNNAQKKTFFSVEQRINFLRQCTSDFDNVEIAYFDGMLVDFASQQNAKFIVRGLRAVSDFEYEFQMASVNKRLRPELETIFLMTRTRHSFLSSSIVRDVGRYGGDLSSMVPNQICKQLQHDLLRQQ